MEKDTHNMIIFGIRTRDNERNSSFKAFCMTREIAERELPKYPEWDGARDVAPTPDESHIVPLTLIMD